MLMLLALASASQHDFFLLVDADVSVRGQAELSDAESFVEPAAMARLLNHSG